MVKRLYDDRFYDWKIILLYQLNEKFGFSYKFPSNETEN